MNTEMQVQLAQIRQQALLAERSSHSSQPRGCSSWMARVQHWLRQTQALNRATALNR